jgi:heme/copper-type cytochrome/quinol oxidase subunit 4
MHDMPAETNHTPHKRRTLRYVLLLVLVIALTALAYWSLHRPHTDPDNPMNLPDGFGLA